MRLFGDPSASIADQYLRRAWRLAERARGATSPNPLVGCVIVAEGVVVGEGWHERAGEPHAEVMALRHAGPKAAGGTAFVTLEPCAHVGRTGACTEALLAAHIAEVVIGMRDPNPNVAGNGAARLAEAGVHVRFAEDAEPFRIQNEAWLHWLHTGRPFVQAKVALTLDGRPALAEGRRSRITGSAALALTMRLRAAADAVVVGGGTVRCDDPALTVRDASGTPSASQPLRVLLTDDASLASAGLLHDGLGPTLVLTSSSDAERAFTDADVAVARYDGVAADAIAGLGARDVARVVVEPGPRLLTSLVEAGAIDELIVYHGGGFGGLTAPSVWTGSSGAEDEIDRRFAIFECGAAGPDAVTVWRPIAGAEGA